MKKIVITPALAIGISACMTLAGGLSAQSFTLTASPSSFGTVMPNATLTSTITVAVSGGFSESMTLTPTPSALPYGTVTIKPGTFQAPGSGTATLTIALTPASGGQIPPGNYTIIIAAESKNNLTETASVTFAISGVAYTFNGMLGPIISGTDPLGLNRKLFGAQTGFVPGDQSTANPQSYTPIGVLITAGTSSSLIALQCSGATATVEVGNASAKGDDTLGVTNCSLLSGAANFVVQLALPSGGFPTTLPAPFSVATLDTSGCTMGSTTCFSYGSYSAFGGSPTVLGISGTLTATCIDCGALTPSPAALSFSAMAGGSAPAAQNLTIDTNGTQIEYYAATATTSGGNWLSVTPDFAQTGGSIAVSVNPGALAAGTYNGAVTICAGATNSPLSVPVTLVVGPAGLVISANPASFAFNWVTGSITPSGSLSISASDGASHAYTATVATTDGHPWLTVSSDSGATGGPPLTVTADPTKVPVGGSYTGAITITATGAIHSVTAPVTFSVTPVSTSPGSLTFTMPLGGANAPGQVVNVTSTGPANLGFTAASSTVTGGNWLSVSPSSGTTNVGSLSVEVSGTALPLGTYQGSIAITAAGATTPIGIPVTLNVIDTLTTLYTFAGAPDGSALVTDAKGTRYGTSSQGGVANLGTVFALLPPASAGGAWTEKVLYSFIGGSDGSGPAAGVILGRNGILYGTTASGGGTNNGTVFQLTPPASRGGDWTGTILYSFLSGVDGSAPSAPLLLTKNGALTGTTYAGGTLGFGTVFELTPPASSGAAWSETILHSFTGPNKFPRASDGANPIAALVEGKSGARYGTTQAGGASGRGTVFELTPPSAPGGAWTEAIIHSFAGGSDGSSPLAAVAISAKKALYGTTQTGGTANAGTIFELKPPAAAGGNWKEEVLYSFTGGTDGAKPAASLVIGKGAVLFGTAKFGGASNAGTVFALQPPRSHGAGWTERLVHNFTGGSDGANPSAALLPTKASLLIGTTSGGSSAAPNGTVFEVKP